MARWLIAGVLCLCGVVLQAGQPPAQTAPFGF